jgi:hypothetical protein
MLHRALMVLGLWLMTLVAVGLFRSGRARECLAFTAYINLATTFGFGIVAFPAWYTPEVFVVKQGIYDTLILGMAIELSIKVFGAFRGVAQTIRAQLAAAVIVSTALVFLSTPEDASYSNLARYQPAISTAGIWCLAFVGLLIVWYQIPVPSFSRAIILGYVPYLLVFVVCVDLIGRLGWGAIEGINTANAVAYDAVAAYWVHAAWRKD